MIRMISGRVVSVANDAVVVDVRGVGYHVYINEPGLQYTEGEDVSLHTYLSVRENALDLYGFSTERRLHIFTLLLTLPKIGPKSAGTIMSQTTTSLLVEAVSQQDASYLTKMSGIGKKTAEKIVAGLKDPFEKANLLVEEAINDTTLNDEKNTPAINDAIDALIALGYPHHDARTVVLEITKAHPSTVTSTELITISLQRMR